MKTYNQGTHTAYSFLTSALDGDEWSISWPCQFNPRKESHYPGIKGWVGPRAIWTFGQTTIVHGVFNMQICVLGWSICNHYRGLKDRSSARILAKAARIFHKQKERSYLNIHSHHHN